METVGIEACEQRRNLGIVVRLFNNFIRVGGVFGGCDGGRRERGGSLCERRKGTSGHEQQQPKGCNRRFLGSRRHSTLPGGESLLAPSYGGAICSGDYQYLRENHRNNERDRTN